MSEVLRLENVTRRYLEGEGQLEIFSGLNMTLAPGEIVALVGQSGAGLPGIVLAMMLPGVRVTLLEPMARRVEFLEECLADLGLDNAEVLRARAEDVAGQLAADVVTARAIAPLDKLAGLALGLARPGGKVLAIKGAAAEAELGRFGHGPVVFGDDLPELGQRRVAAAGRPGEGVADVAQERQALAAHDFLQQRSGWHVH